MHIPQMRHPPSIQYAIIYVYLHTTHSMYKARYIMHIYIYIYTTYYASIHLAVLDLIKLLEHIHHLNHIRAEVLHVSLGSRVIKYLDKHTEV